MQLSSFDRESSASEIKSKLREVTAKLRAKVEASKEVMSVEQHKLISEALAYSDTINKEKDENFKKESLEKFSKLVRGAFNEWIVPREMRDKMSDTQRGHQEPVSPRSIGDGATLESLYSDNPTNLKDAKFTSSGVTPALVAEKIVRDLGGGYYVDVQDAYDGYTQGEGHEAPAWPYASAKQKCDLALILASFGFAIDYDKWKKAYEKEAKAYDKKYKNLGKGDRDPDDGMITAQVKPSDTMSYEICAKCNKTTPHKITPDRNYICQECGNKGEKGKGQLYKGSKLTVIDKFLKTAEDKEDEDTSKKEDNIGLCSGCGHKLDEFDKCEKCDKKTEFRQFSKKAQVDNTEGQLVNHDNYFDAAQALYWYAANYHEGQNSPLYSILSTLGYNPGANEREPDTIESRMFYKELERNEINPSDLMQEIERIQEERSGRDSTVEETAPGMTDTPPPIMGQIKPNNDYKLSIPVITDLNNALDLLENIKVQKIPHDSVAFEYLKSNILSAIDKIDNHYQETPSSVMGQISKKAQMGGDDFIVIPQEWKNPISGDLSVLWGLRDNNEGDYIGPFISEEAAMDWLAKHSEETAPGMTDTPPPVMGLKLSNFQNKEGGQSGNDSLATIVPNEDAFGKDAPVSPEMVKSGMGYTCSNEKCKYGDKFEKEGEYKCPKCGGMMVFGEGAGTVPGGGKIDFSQMTGSPSGTAPNSLRSAPDVYIEPKDKSSHSLHISMLQKAVEKGDPYLEYSLVEKIDKSAAEQMSKSGMTKMKSSYLLGLISA